MKNIRDEPKDNGVFLALNAYRGPYPLYLRRKLNKMDTLEGLRRRRRGHLLPAEPPPQKYFQVLFKKKNC